jgi:peptidoglycan/LPS O-acetylase OafA/YrhL
MASKSAEKVVIILFLTGNTIRFTREGWGRYACRMGKPGVAGRGTRGAFRSDINALRALSVAAVVGYHLRIAGFAGGFVGVDVFFVITGYLMTRKVLSDLACDRFSLIDFVGMRARRIYPALAVMVVSSAVAGWFLTMPDQYFRQLRQAFYALTFLSNFAFDNDNGYFSMAAQTKPLLHTWSLAVEWQFYIWMPLVAWAVWYTFGRKSGIAAITRSIQILTAISLAWCLWKSQGDMLGSAFFSLRARAWEPLAGGLIAAYEIQRLAPGDWRRIKLASAVAGWMLIIACIVYPLPEVPWPASLTVLPVLGSMMVIAARQEERVFAVAAIQRIGDWSYSIYLWHWPIWVFAAGWLSLRGYDVTLSVKAWVTLASLALGFVSYRFIEQPVRVRREIWTPRRMATASSIAIASFAGFAALTYLNDGFPYRMPSYLQQALLARQTDTPRDECFRNSNSVKNASGNYCSFGAEATGKTTVILWGDSFANQYLVPISAAATANGVDGLIATQSACRAFADDPNKNARDERPCRDFNRNTLDFVERQAEPSIVVLASNWTDGAEVSALVDRLLGADKIVILVKPLLNVGFDVPQRWIEAQLRTGAAINEWKIEADPVVTLNVLKTEIAARLAKYQGDPRLITVDPSSVICETGYCYLVRNGQANFRDTAHISNINAMQYREVFDAAFRLANPTGIEAAARPD